NYLNGVAVVTASDLWAVGTGSDYSLTEHYSGPCVTDTPTPTVTQTPTPTQTRTITRTPTITLSPTITLTPSITPTCPATGPFTDVLPDNPFYSYVRCLYCHWVITGYTTSPPCTTGVPCY